MTDEIEAMLSDEDKAELERIFESHSRVFFKSGLPDELGSLHTTIVTVRFGFSRLVRMSRTSFRTLKPLINDNREPPAVAEGLLMLLVKGKYRDSLAITLAEEFERRLQNGCSLGRARRLYWLSVINSLGPQARAFVRRHGVKTLNWLGAAGLIEEVVRRLTH